MDHTFYTHSSADGHSGCFHVLALVNRFSASLFKMTASASHCFSLLSLAHPSPLHQPFYGGSWPMDQGSPPREGDKPYLLLLLYNVPHSLRLPCFTPFICYKCFQVTGWLWAISSHPWVSFSSPKWGSCRKWPLGPLPKPILTFSASLTPVSTHLSTLPW